MAVVKGNIRPLNDKVLVSNMDFGEQVSAGGIVILSDDAKDRGIHPRWAQVWAKGHANKEPYDIGDWVLIEHGRWTRGIKHETESGEELTLRMIDNKCVLCFSKEKPNDVIIGQLTGGDAPPTIRPEEFI
jgi:co-chaperonin GroES (HSP10)